MRLDKLTAKILTRTIKEQRPSGLTRVTLEVNSKDEFVVWDKSQGGYLPIFENGYSLLVLAAYTRHTTFNNTYRSYSDVYQLAAIFEFDSETLKGSYYVSDKILSNIYFAVASNEQIAYVTSNKTIDLQRTKFMGEDDKKLVIKYDIECHATRLREHQLEYREQELESTVERPIRIVRKYDIWDYTEDEDGEEKVFIILTYIIEASEIAHEQVYEYVTSTPELYLINREILKQQWATQ